MRKILLSIILMAVLSSCGDKEKVDPIMPENLVGTWTLDFVYTSSTVSGGSPKSATASASPASMMTLNEDGSLLLSSIELTPFGFDGFAFNKSYQGTYELTDSDLEIIIEGINGQEVYGFEVLTLDESNLELVQDLDQKNTDVSTNESFYSPAQLSAYRDYFSTLSELEQSAVFVKE